MTIRNTMEGGCFCGAVRYRATGEPIVSTICHCKTCRRIAAAPTVAWLTFNRDDLKFVKGQPSQLRSSANVVRTFCGACGTGLTYMSDQFPDQIDVTACSLDDPNAYPPTHHSWMSHDLPWVKSTDGLIAYAESGDEGTHS